MQAFAKEFDWILKVLKQVAKNMKAGLGSLRLQMQAFGKAFDQILKVLKHVARIMKSGHEAEGSKYKLLMRNLIRF